jgi:hypothetical protein
MATDISVDFNLQGFVFSTTSGEMIKLCEDGRVYIKGKEVADDLDLVKAIQEWITTSKQDVVNDTVAKMREMQKINYDATKSSMDDYFKGMYNGMEALISVISKQEPRYIEKGLKGWSEHDKG